MKKALGFFLLSLPFTSMFGYFWYDIGLKSSLFVFGTTALIGIVVVACVYGASKCFDN